MSKCLQKLRGSSPEQNTRLQLLHSDTHVVFRRLSVVFSRNKYRAARNKMSFGITTSASSILKACGRCRSRTGLTDIGAPHRSFSHDIHNRPYVRLFRTANIMNRHVVTVNCCMILQRSTSIDTLWTYMGFTILSQSTTFFHILVAPITTSNFRKWCVHWYKTAESKGFEPL